MSTVPGKTYTLSHEQFKRLSALFMRFPQRRREVARKLLQEIAAANGDTEAITSDGRTPIDPLPVQLTREEAARLVQWFHSMQDTNPKYIEPRDHHLAQHLARQ